MITTKPPRPLVPIFLPCPIITDPPADPPPGNDYDTAEFRADVAGWFAPLPVDWQWVPITLATVGKAVEAAAAAARQRPVIVLNFCDGTEEDGYPGLSVLHALEAAGLPATGADTRFYEISTSKLAMKRRFAAAGVATSPWVEIGNTPSGMRADLQRAANELGWPLFLKPDTSAASVGISQRSLVRNLDEAMEQTKVLYAGQHGARFEQGGVYAENFLSGREFTVLLQSTGESAQAVEVYPPCERVFHSALPLHERFLSYERYWEQYETETPPPQGEPYYRHEAVEPELGARIADTAKSAYLAAEGRGYARVDLRINGNTGEINVLEVNANCGLTSDDQSSAGAILHQAGVPLAEFIRRALREAWVRQCPSMPAPL